MPRPLVDALLSLLSPPRCSACDRRLGRDAVFCASCLSTLERPAALPAAITASFAFGGALAEVIRRWKYGLRGDLARPLRRLVVEGLPDPRAIDLVAPVPLHVARLRTRGFDQAALLAAAVARALDRPLARSLVTRVIETPQLVGLDLAARSAAVRGAFVAGRCRGLRVLIVDDVRTTGATLDSAITALLDAGASPRAHVLAATPRG